MKFSFATKLIAACLTLTGVSASFSHVTLEQGSAPAGSYYKAVFRVGHGCAGSPTTGIKVELPVGFVGAKPMPKPGWSVAVDANAVSWSEGVLPDGHYDEFVLRGKLPDAVGPLWFKVLQTCGSGSNQWIEVPISGLSTQGLKAPAALLKVTPAQVGHQH